jgi:purine-binding chemotaxis protein CheW
MSLYDRFSKMEQEILNARARRVASKSHDDEQKKELSALIIRMQDERYALPIEAINVVHEEILVEPMPCVPPFVAGIANVRGHIVPVIHLARLLGLPAVPLDGPTSLIVVGSAEMTVALFVEAIDDVAALPLDRLAPVPASLATDRKHHLQGVLPDGTILLDVDSILDDPDLIVDEQAG